METVKKFKLRGPKVLEGDLWHAGLREGKVADALVTRPHDSGLLWIQPCLGQGLPESRHHM